MTLVATGDLAAVRPDRRWMPHIAVAGALVGFAGLQIAALRIAGVFEYPLDDVYIHLAMAAGMAGGTYGVNPGEAASAASSILYPVLLMPFPGTEAQRMLPLLWNLVGLALSAGLWGAILLRSALPGWAAWPLALAGPVLLNMAGVAFLGMEHALHAAASLGIVLGLALWVQDRRLTPLLVASVILAPVLRLEGLALSLGAAGVVGLTGNLRAGLGMGLGAVLPVLAFMGGLMALGLPPLPSSVLTKLTTVEPGTPFFGGIVLKVIANLRTWPGILLAVLVISGLLVTLLAVLGKSARGRSTALLLAVLSAAGASHLVQGQVGWLHRYEHYIVVALVAGLAIAAGQARGWLRQTGAALVVLLVLAAGAAWLPRVLTSFVWNPRAVHLQQAQMARFAQDFAREPVAVNDLGRVVWGNPDHVLDLWGLASDRARRLRLERTPPEGWAGILTRENGVRLAMIYDPWVRNGVPSDWQALGKLTMTAERGYLGSFTVSFYATDPAAAVKLRQDLQAFVPTLPAGAQFIFTPAGP